MQINSGALDRWITGNYGEDHPDNQAPRCVHCDEELHEDETSCPFCGEMVE